MHSHRKTISDNTVITIRNPKASNTSSSQNSHFLGGELGEHGDGARGEAKTETEWTVIAFFLFIITIIIVIIVSIITVFAGVLFVHQPDANHAPRASVTQVNHSVHTLSTFLRIHADPSMQIF